jgi:hypothetical protein
MSIFFLVSKNEFCDVIDRIQEQKLTVTIPVKWIPSLDVIEDEEEPPIGYELEDGEIYQSNETKNRLAFTNFMVNLVVTPIIGK